MSVQNVPFVAQTFKPILSNISPPTIKITNSNYVMCVTSGQIGKKLTGTRHVYRRILSKKSINLFLSVMEFFYWCILYECFFAASFKNMF